MGREEVTRILREWLTISFFDQDQAIGFMLGRLEQQIAAGTDTQKRQAKAALKHLDAAIQWARANRNGVKS